jgi:hypothetical protein
MSLFFSEPVPPRPKRPPRKSFLFPFAEADRPLSARASTSGTKQPIGDAADNAVVALFLGLQKIWRRQGTLRRTYDGMPSSREEREVWKQLIQYLIK